MKKIEQLTNLYSLSKTLKFRLIPQGETNSNIEKLSIIADDKDLSKKYKKAKEIIDKYHKDVINEVLSQVELQNLDEYENLINSCQEDKEKHIKNCELKLRIQIIKYFEESEKYKNLFTKELIKQDLPKYLEDEEDKQIISKFEKFVTYFAGFNENRKNIYSKDEKSTSVAFRAINQNLPKFLNNIKIVKNIKEKYIDLYNDIVKINTKWNNFNNCFTLNNYSMFLSQLSIDQYNAFIGEVNKKINLYCQANKVKIPMLKPLFKQILSDKVSLFNLPEEFTDDKSLLVAINDFYSKKEENYSIKDKINLVDVLFSNLKNYNLKMVYIDATKLTEFSNYIFKDWSTIKNAWLNFYDSCQNGVTNTEKYFENREKEYKKIKVISLDEISNLPLLCEECIDLPFKILENVKNRINNINGEYAKIRVLLETEYNSNKKLSAEKEDVEKIKFFLDSIKDLQRFLKLFYIPQANIEKDDVFYTEFDNLYNAIELIVPLYNKCRNYLTKKPYSIKKIKLNFRNSQLLNGWDANKERDYCTCLLLKDNKYYLCIINRENNKVLENVKENSEGKNYKKVIYKLLPGPNKMLPKVFFSKKNLDYYAPSKEILNSYEQKTHIKGESFNIEDCHRLINFFKESILKHKEWKNYNFKFKDTRKYESIKDFYKEVQEQGYKIDFQNVSEDEIDKLITQGKIFLFKIYNKDFSEYSSGNKNLHTVYFEMLFNTENLSNVVYALNGGAEMFYREASLPKPDKATHPKGEPINRKNLNNPGISLFSHDIQKDKRFTENQYFLHLPITLNFKTDGSEKQGAINEKVRGLIKDSKENYIIGIDRGERNLLSVVVLNSKGEIKEQRSLNIINQVDYHALLEQREMDRDSARKNWQTISNIKNIKEGYLSLAISEICKLIVKYDAIVVLEDLNFGFKNSRTKFERQVYQKFESMLINKLNYYCDKNQKDLNKSGGLLKAYQLTGKFEGFNNLGKQSGFLFYVPAWNTSKIDPTTGFVNLLKLKYKSINESQNFIDKTFNGIEFNKNDNCFKFDLFYDLDVDYVKNWKIYTFGDRIIHKLENNIPTTQKINLTQEFISLFELYGLNYKLNNLKEQILKQNNKEFFEKFIKLINYTLQLRNTNSATGEDYILSPVKNKQGEFYDSRNYINIENAILPKDADANGAYHIALKGLWVIKQIQTAENVKNVKLAISNKEWLQFAQTK